MIKRTIQPNLIKPEHIKQSWTSTGKEQLLVQKLSCFSSFCLDFSSCFLDPVLQALQFSATRNFQEDSSNQIHNNPRNNLDKLLHYTKGFPRITEDESITAKATRSEQYIPYPFTNHPLSSHRLPPLTLKNFIITTRIVIDEVLWHENALGKYKNSQRTNTRTINILRS